MHLYIYIMFNELYYKIFSAISMLWQTLSVICVNTIEYYTYLMTINGLLVNLPKT